MQDTELYRHVLGLETPWKVDSVRLDVPGGRVDVWAVHEEGRRWACPDCRTELPIYDHAPERIWRHLDTCQFKTYLHARVPRVECPTHGVRQVSVPWAEARSRFTALFERLAIDVLNGSDLLRRWVDDPAATPADLEALTAPDEAAWREEREALLLYR